MIELKNTHGPWITFKHPKKRVWVVTLPAYDTPNMRINIFPDGVPGDSEEEYEGNARLIAAAPVMFDALSFLEKSAAFDCKNCLWENVCKPNACRIRKQLSAVLAEARGESEATP